MPAVIPNAISEVTPHWLAEVTGLAVNDAAIEQIGVGVGVSSALYRARLDGDHCPASVVIKLPALDEAAVFTSTILRMYLREVAFFERLAAMSPVRVPACFHAAVDPDTSRFVVVMEDLGGLRAVDQVKGMEIADAERAVDQLAAWHATWWGKAAALADEAVTVSLGDPIYPAVLPMVFAEGWDIVTGALDLPDVIVELGPRWTGALPKLLTDLSTEPTTLLHGDYRADNMLFDAEGSVALLDFQLIGTGTGAYDLAYFVTQSLDAAVAAEHERALFNRWISGLIDRGVPKGDLERMWEDYRKAAFFCLVYPVVASRGMDLDDPRQRDLLGCMNARLGRAIEQLDLAELV